MVLTHNGYHIEHYRPEFKSQVLDTLRPLLGDNSELNKKYFKWKYEDNPYARFPMGIVALMDNRVAGFRGYFATKWQSSRKQEFILLEPGDTCINPEHRRKGLSVLMGNFAMSEYSDRYKIFLNTTCTLNSLPGYQRLGFTSLAKKTYITRCNFYGLFKYILTSKEISGIDRNRVKFGTFDDIKVSEKPLPEQMFLISQNQEPDKNKINLVQDKAFFIWRFGNPFSQYLFYYYENRNNPAAYLVIGLSPNSQRAYLLDYAEFEKGSVEKILRFILREKQFDLISVYNCAAHGSLLKLKTVSGHVMTMLEKKVKGDLPFLIRPVLNEYCEEDWFFDGIDLRKISNWSFKGICADDA